MIDRKLIFKRTQILDIKYLSFAWILFLNTFILSACNTSVSDTKNKIMENVQLDTATFGAGCFWCVEAIFAELKGVKHVESGYCNGHVKNPSYKEVCTGTTGHAEVIQLHYDPSEISFDELLEVFWMTHDPTTLNRQGADVGTQYRSGVYYHNDEQKQKAQLYKEKLNASGAYDAAIVTEIVAINNYYKAEDYHQNYFANNPDQGYCSYVIKPKMDKFKKVFGDKLKN